MTSVRCRLVAVFMWLIMLVGVMTPASAPAQTNLSVRLTDVTPQTITASDDLHVTGEVTNTTDQPQDITVNLWRDATPIRSHEALETAADNPAGQIVDSADASQHFDSVAPGETVTFEISYPVAGRDPLYISDPGAAYQVGVRVINQAPGGAIGVSYARAFVVTPGEVQAHTAHVVVLSHPQTRLILDDTPDGTPVFANTSLIEALAGDLTELLNYAIDKGLYVIVDPVLYDEVTILTLGHYSFASGSSTPDEATSRLAAGWLTRLRTYADQGKVWRGLYGMPDVTAGAAAGINLTAHAETALGTDHDLATLPLAVLPRAGRVTPDAIKQVLSIAKPDYIFASNIATNQTLATADYDTPVVRITGEDDISTDTVMDQSRMAAEQYVSALHGHPIVSVIRDSAGLESARTPPTWQVPISFDDLLSSESGEMAYVNETIDAPAQLVATTDTLGPEAATWASARYPNEHRYWALVTAVWSTNLTPDEGVAWFRTATAHAREVDLDSSLTLQVRNWVTTSGDGNYLPVTIVNETDYPLTARVSFSSSNELRLSVQDSDPVEIAPHQTGYARVMPSTHANGTVELTAQLETVQNLPIGTGATFTATGTDAGRLAWVIIVVSAVVLFAATSWRIKAVRQRADKD